MDMRGCSTVIRRNLDASIDHGALWHRRTTIRVMSAAILVHQPALPVLYTPFHCGPRSIADRRESGVVLAVVPSLCHVSKTYRALSSPSLVPRLSWGTPHDEGTLLSIWASGRSLSLSIDALSLLDVGLLWRSPL